MSPSEARVRYVVPQQLRREQSHRRTVLVGIAALIVLSTTPVFGHHLETQGHLLLAGRDHLGPFCLIALHLLLEPVHRAFHLALMGGLAYALWNRAVAWRAMRRTLRSLDARGPEANGAVAAAARRAGLDASRIRMVDGLPNPAFTVGFWHPVVYVSASLPLVLDAAQLEAVLAHEACHVARRDPLRLTLLRTLACILFYVPALRRLADDLADEAEIDADDVAASRGSPLVLASAILALVDWTSMRGARAVAVPDGMASGIHLPHPGGDVDLLDRRIRRLAGESTVVGTRVTRRSLGAATAVLCAVWASGIMMAHPLPALANETEVGMRTTSAHCAHHNRSALAHLFCLGLNPSRDGRPCPHAAVSDRAEG